MNNNDNNDLFAMYGLEHEKVENNSTNSNNTIATEIKENVFSQQNAEKVIESNDIKPISDIILNESNIHDVNSEEELLKLYIGPNYESIINGSFSYCTIFLGLFYLYYRKQYSYAYALLVIQVGVILAYDFLVRSLFYILIFLHALICYIISVNFKKNYVAKAKEKIAEINNENVSLDEKKAIIKKVGGVDNKAYILFISFFILAYVSSVITFKYLVQSSDLVFHFPEAFQQNTTTNETEYKIGKYKYYDLVVNHRTSDNVCNYKIVVNNEYLGDNKKTIITKYLKDKYNLDNITLEKNKYNDREYFHYYDEKEKKDYYIHLSDKSFSEIGATYIKDENKKCHGYTEYILNNS